MFQGPIRVDNETRRVILRDLEKLALDDLATCAEEDKPQLEKHLAEVRRKLDQHWALEE